MPYHASLRSPQLNCNSALSLYYCFAPPMTSLVANVLFILQIHSTQIWSSTFVTHSLLLGKMAVSLTTSVIQEYISIGIDDISQIVKECHKLPVYELKTFLYIDSAFFRFHHRLKTLTHYTLNTCTRRMLIRKKNLIYGLYSEVSTY